MRNVLMVEIIRAFQFLGANEAEHDAEREKAEHANHQKNVNHTIRLSIWPLCSMVGIVLRCHRRQKTCAVEEVL